MAIIEHLLQFLLALALLAGPVPTSLWVGRKAGSNPVDSVFFSLLSWFLLQNFVTLGLGLLGGLTLGTALCVETGLFLVGGCAWAKTHRAQGPGMGGPASRLETALLAILGLVALDLFLRSSSRVITDYDSVAYHLPAMATWYEAGAITLLDLYELGMVVFYPFNWETLHVLTVLPFHEDLLVSLPALGAWGLLGISCYLISLELGARRSYALVGTALVLLSPALCRHVHTLLVDLALVAFFTAALYLVLRLSRKPSFLILSLLIATLGFLSGTKATGLLYASLLLVTGLLLFIGTTLSQKCFPRFRGGSWIFGILLVLGGLASGGGWYVRTVLQFRALFGSPLAYAEAGRLYLDRIGQTTLVRLFDPGAVDHWLALAKHAARQFNLPFALCLVLATGLIFRFRSSCRASFLLLWLLGATGAIYCLTPFSGNLPSDGDALGAILGFNLRFAFPFLALLGTAGAVGASRLNIPERLLVPLALGAGLFPYGFSGAEPLSLLLTAPLLVILLSAWIRPGTLIRKATILGLAVVLLAGLTFLLRGQRAENRKTAYGATATYISEQIPEQETLGYLYSHESYLFRGKNLEHGLVYVPSSADDAALWAEGLRRRGIRYVAIGAVETAWTKMAEKNFLRELTWLEEGDGSFVKVAGEDAFQEPLLFRLKEQPSNR